MTALGIPISRGAGRPLARSRYQRGHSPRRVGPVDRRYAATGRSVGFGSQGKALVRAAVTGTPGAELPIGTFGGKQPSNERGMRRGTMGLGCLRMLVSRIQDGVPPEARFPRCKMARHFPETRARTPGPGVQPQDPPAALRPANANISKKVTIRTGALGHQRLRRLQSGHFVAGGPARPAPFLAP